MEDFYEENTWFVTNYFFLTSCTHRSSCIHFIDYQNRTVNWGGIEAKYGDKAYVNTGSLSLDTKNRDVSEQMQRLDRIQYDICIQIEGMPDGPEKIELQNTVIKAQLELMKLIGVSGLEQSSIDTTNNETIDKIAQLEKELSEQKRQQEIIKEYSDVARINFDGRIELGGISTGSAVSGWKKDFVKDKDGKMTAKCSPDAFGQYKETINKYPKYPFPYFLIAMCLKGQHDPAWRDYAKVGIGILEKTTMVPIHSPSHDDVLKRLNDMLSEDERK